MRKRSTGKPGDLRQRVFDVADALRRRGELERVARCIVGGDSGFRLHRIAGDALRPNLDAHHVSRRRHRRIGGLAIAVLVFERQIAGHLVVNAHRARGAGIGGFDQHRQVLVVHLDQFGGILRHVLGLGDDHRDRLADEADAFVRQPETRRHVER